MQQFFYLAALIFSLSGLLTIDRKFKLIFWHSKNAAIKTLLSAIAIFTIWDIIGIMIGIFFHGGSKYTLPIRLAPEFPLEELFFLLLLNYTSLIIYLMIGKRWQRT